MCYNDSKKINNFDKPNVYSTLSLTVTIAVYEVFQFGIKDFAVEFSVVVEIVRRNS